MSFHILLAMPPGIPDLSPCRPRFHPRFAHVSSHVSEWVPFFVAGVYVGLVLGMQNKFPGIYRIGGWDFGVCICFRQLSFDFQCPNLRIQVSLGTAPRKFLLARCVRADP